MKTNHALGIAQKGNSRHILAIALVAIVAPLRAGLCQTNATQSGNGQTNAVSYRLPAPSDFQRLQYYYAANQNSPAPGSESGIFTLGANRTWSGDWSSAVVPAPTRAQLNAITAQQVDLFNRAAIYTNGAWRVVTSLTNIPLSALTVSPSTYAPIRAATDRDKQSAIYQRLQLQTTQSRSISP